MSKVDLDDIIEKIEDQEIVLAESNGTSLTMVFWVIYRVEPERYPASISFFVNDKEYELIEDAVEAYNKLV